MSDFYSVRARPRDLIVYPVRRKVYGAGETGRTVYNGTYAVEDWLNWGQENVFPFGPDYTKTFGDLP